MNFFPLIATTILAATAAAAEINMDDPHRAVGRERDVRIDAQLLTDVVRPGSAISVTYQIQNFTDTVVAVAEKIADASYDSDSRTIVVSVGSEIPPDGAMPRMATIGPGEKKTFTAAARLQMTAAAGLSPRAAMPRYVQIKVSVLRNLEPFIDLLERQAKTTTAPAALLDDDQFEEWLERNDTIFLNTLPIRFERGRGSRFDASQRGRANRSM